ncbi:MAG: hypothetical protein KC925_03765 [Candidatus Doudnabacteria bacterium]|nr:hypothetical protein [Candidatus Doudnabacteria bacterium]
MIRSICTLFIIAAIANPAAAEEPPVQAIKVWAMGNYADADEAKAALADADIKVDDGCETVDVDGRAEVVCGCKAVATTYSICLISTQTTVAAN